MSKSLIVIIILVLLGAGGYYLYANRSTLYPTTSPVVTPTYTTPTPTTGEKVTVVMKEQNNSGERGTAALEEVGGKVKVTLNLTGTSKGATQPAHIHTGTCANIGAVLYPLTFPVDGESETTLNVTMAELRAQMPLALNVHKSQTEANIYYSCGDLPL